MQLRVNHGALVVRNGFTHYPQPVEEHRFFRRDRQLPSRIIVIDGSGSLSFDVLSWLAEQNVPLVRLDWRGTVVTVVGGNHTADPRVVARQLEAQKPGRAVVVAASLIRQKIANSIATLKTAIPPSPARELALGKLHREAELLDRYPPKSITTLLGLEGRVAYAYFNSWQSLPLQWRGVGRHPIPKDWHYVGQRQSYTRKKGRNRHASHPVNAILNYAYAILESQVRIQILAQGYDPTIGVMHVDKPDRPAFVFDLMEPMRPVVDRKVLEFVQAHTFHPSDFTLKSDGACRLNPGLARRIVHLVLDAGTGSSLASAADTWKRKQTEQTNFRPKRRAVLSL
jgi:CRISPR-associated endonuclease Cas1